MRNPQLLQFFQSVLFSLSKEDLSPSGHHSHPTKYFSQTTSPVLAISPINAIIYDGNANIA